MADYLIELAQLARLLNQPLEDQEFLDLAIQHFPQEARSALIVAKPTDFGSAVKLLKQLQGRKVSERVASVNLGLYNQRRRGSNRGNGNSAMDSGAGILSKHTEHPSGGLGESGAYSKAQSHRNGEDQDLEYRPGTSKGN